MNQPSPWKMRFQIEEVLINQRFPIYFNEVLRVKKLVVGLLVAAVILAAIFVMNRKPSAEQAYNSFAQQMDSIFGTENWSAKSYNPVLQDGHLTVSGLSVTPPEKIGTITVETLEFANAHFQTPPLGENWQGQKDLLIADKIVLRQIRYDIPSVEEGIVSFATLEELSIMAPTLKAAVPLLPSGFAGYLQSLSLGDLAYKNLSFASNKGEEEIMEFKIAANEVKGLSFTGKPFPGLKELTPHGDLLLAFSAFNSQSAKTTGLSSVFKNEDIQVSFSIDQLESSGVQASGMAESFTVTGLKLDSTATGELSHKLTMSLGQANIKGFDATDYLEKTMPAMALLSTEPQRAEEMLNQFQTLGSTLVAPIGLAELSFVDWNLSINDLYTIKLAESKTVGDYQVGKIPTNSKHLVRDFEIILPKAEKLTAEEDAELKGFIEDVGLTHFVMNAETESNYDPISGQYTNHLKNFDLKDVVKLSGQFEAGGLTAERVEALNKIPVEMAYLALLAPEATFGDFSMQKFDLKIEDQGLIDLIFNVMAKQDESNGLSAQQMKNMVTASIAPVLYTQGRQYLANPEVLAEALIAFFSDPKSLEVSITPQPPLTYSVFNSYGGDFNKLLNSLNATVKGNGQEAAPLQFNIVMP